MKTQNYTKTMISVISIGLMLGCGNVEDKKTKANTETETSTETVTADTTLAAEDTSTQATSALESVTGLDSTATTALALTAGFNKSGDFTKTEERDCSVSEDGTTVTVTIAKTKEKEQTHTKGEITKSISSKKTSNITRTWTKDGASLACNDGNTHIALKPSELTGATMKAEFSREFSGAMERTKGEETKTFSRTRSATGTRTITFNSATAADGNVTINKTVKISTAIEATRLNKKGESTSTNITMVTAEDAPLVLEVVKKDSDRSWVSRKIISGKTIGTNADGGSLTMTWENALFTKDTECEPVSGTVSGSFANKEGQVTKTFTADLSQETKTIVFDDGETQTMDFSDCGFSKPAKATVKRVKKINQTKKSGKLEKRKIKQNT